MILPKFEPFDAGFWWGLIGDPQAVCEAGQTVLWSNAFCVRWLCACRSYCFAAVPQGIELLLLLLLQMIQQGTNNVYPEVEGLSILLGFKTQNAGCCKVRAVTAALQLCLLACLLPGWHRTFLTRFLTWLGCCLGVMLICADCAHCCRCRLNGLCMFLCMGSNDSNA